MRAALAMALLLAAALASVATAQPIVFPGAGQNQGFNGPGGNLNGQNQNGQQGGGQNADFESLIDLIISTVDPDSWAENGGGEAEVRPYVGGVYADAGGLLRRVQANQTGSLSSDLKRARASLTSIRERVAERRSAAPTDPRAPAGLRCVSLTRLEQELNRRLGAGESLDPAMLTLAGLRRVRYVLLKETNEVVLAGPAGDWRPTGDGRVVADDTGESVVRLDDLLTLMRRSATGSQGPFGCSINPRQESLAAAQAFLGASQSKPVPPRRRDKWLAELRDRVGVQDIEVFGVEPTSRVAGVLVEADHHMKLIGMGLVDGVPGVEDYLTGLARKPEGAASTGVLRWWFAMHYTAINASADGDAFELVGPAARVMSERELLTDRGQRVAADRGDELAEGFADSFSRHFAALCRKYPVYSELRNAFDLSVAIELIADARRSGATAWRPSLFINHEQLPMPVYEPARTVETVVNHRVVNKRRFVAGVSGGVWGDARQIIDSRREPVDPTRYGPLGADAAGAPEDLAAGQWWWDAE